MAAALLPALAGGADYAGADTCRACHPQAYAAWKAGPHAKARENLPEASRQDPKCLACHAPDADKGIAAVTCETCHGAGQYYSAPYVMRDKELSRLVGLVDPGERQCLGCHTAMTPSLFKFVYAQKLPLIDHWTAEKQARQKKSPPTSLGARPLHEALATMMQSSWPNSPSVEHP